MSYQHNLINWHILADRFIWSDENALSSIPQEITDEEIQNYLYTFHGDTITINEIREWRLKHIQDHEITPS
jgi:hypothetical protein